MNRLFAALALLMLTSCATPERVAGLRTKAFLYEAYLAWQNNDHERALKSVKSALETAPKENVPGDVLVEVYDDAGLYYFLNDQGQQSFIHQAVAVLLADHFTVTERMRRFYFGNLRKAYAVSELDLAMDAIEKDHRILLTIPAVRDNPNIIKYYSRPDEQHRPVYSKPQSHFKKPRISP
jgi:hypothetical protein